MSIVKMQTSFTKDTIFQIHTVLTTTANTMYRNGKKEDTNSP